MPSSVSTALLAAAAVWLFIVPAVAAVLATLAVAFELLVAYAASGS